MHFFPATSPLESRQMPATQQSGSLLGGARTLLFSNVRKLFIVELFVFICLPPGMCLSNKAHGNHVIHYYLALLGSGVQRISQSWKASLPLFLSLWKMKHGDNSIQLHKHRPQRNASYPLQFSRKKTAQCKREKKKNGCERLLKTPHSTDLSR